VELLASPSLLKADVVLTDVVYGALTTLRACGDLEQQAQRLKHLVDSFRI
jgi:hypothetical protein